MEEKIAKMFGGKTLKGGTAKQKKWAEIIRCGKLQRISNADDAVTVATYESAKWATWWIEHKDTNAEHLARNIKNLRESK